MRKRRSKLVKQSRLLVQLSKSTRYTSHPLSSAWCSASNGGIERGGWSGLWSVPQAQTLRRFPLLFRNRRHCRSTKSSGADHRTGFGPWSDPRAQAAPTLGKGTSDDIGGETDNAALLAPGQCFMARSN